MFARKRQRPDSPAGPATVTASHPTAATPVSIASQASMTTSDRSPVSASASTASIATAPAAPFAPSVPTQRRGSTNVSRSSTSETLASDAAKTVRKARSWYGTWPRMPRPEASTQLAREVAITNTLRAGHTADFTKFTITRTKTESAEDLTRDQPKSADIQTTTPSLADEASCTRRTSQQSRPQPKQDATDDLPEPEPPAVATSEIEHNTTPAAQLQPPATSTSWLGWLVGSSSAIQTATAVGEPTMPDENQQAANESTAAADTVAGSKTQDVGVLDSPGHEAQTAQPSGQSTGSWFGFWPATTGTSSVEAKPQVVELPVQDPTPAAAPEDPPVSASAAKPAASAAVGSTWAFWSRDTRKQETDTHGVGTDQGEIAVISDASESTPQKAQDATVEELNGSVSKTKGKSTKTTAAKAIAPQRSKKSRPESLDLDAQAKGRRESSQSEPAPARSTTPTTAPVTSTQRTLTPSTTSPPNLVIPSFNSTYCLKDNPSVVKQITQFLLRTKQPPAKHVYLTKEPIKLRKAVAIGVHGWFPASYLRPMIGQPTGTSIRFMNHGADAIRKWAGAHGCGDCEIEKIALEGDGKISERVDNLWKLLLNWIEHLRQADLIILACHSQGVPVGLMLVAKLIDLGIVSGARIGICAMAGVCLGPFADYKASMGMLMGSAAELWEFGDAESEISKRLEQSLQVVLEFGARVTFVGSIDDQLVPLDSAVYSPATHPYIFRAVFINGQVHASDFIAHLIGFALKLRNLGISDHGLVRELSLPLAGSLYSGEGHSKLYDEQQIYDLAVVHALETSSVPQTPCHFGARVPVSKQPNPYLLPWSMRGLLEEDFVRTELSKETTELLEQFDAWEPSTKPLKDVKWRLEAVRSKL